MQLTGYVGGSQFNVREVRKVLGQYPGKHVDILIDSFGGSLAEGLSICGALRDHGDVTVHFRGMNASAATLASMGAKKVIIAPESMYLVHKVSMGFFDWADRNSDQLDEFIKLLQSTKDDLDTMDRSIAELYASRCKKPAKDLLELMKAEKWITSSDAKAWGFVDEITAVNDDERTEAEIKNGKPSITRAQADGFRTLGLPLPPVDVEPEGRSQIAEIVRSIVEPIKSFLNSSKDMNTEQQHQNTEQQEQPTVQQEQVSEQQEQPSGQEQQTDGQADGEESNDKDAEIARLKAEIATLKGKTPGAETKNVVAQPTNSGKKEPENDFTKFVTTGKNAKALFDALP